MKIVLILFLLTITVSCSTLQQSKEDIDLNYIDYKNNSDHNKIKSFTLSGKISLFLKEKGFSGRIKWSSESGYDVIEIYNPFNSIISKISLNESLGEITFDPASENKSKDTELAIRQIFGDTANIFVLKNFLLHPPNQLTENETVSVVFQGWTIKYSGYQDAGHITTKTVEYTKSNNSLKIFINDLNYEN